jgi:hypothetical protein
MTADQLMLLLAKLSKGLDDVEVYVQTFDGRTLRVQAAFRRCDDMGNGEYNPGCVVLKT